MYHQKIPSYNGAQPFIYAVYCKEDESLVYPVLGRMYNEGFRVCCAPATGISSDFHTQQRLAAASSVIIFLSQQMSERLRTGDPEVVTAARSPLVRTVIQLDESDVKNSAFAMSVPDHERYQAENDSAFWLYIYSNDYFDCCRGPWPENKLLLREPTYEDVSEDVVSEEYRRLENIMSGSKTSSAAGYDPFDRSSSYQNNPGYIEPQPDEYTYVPLGLVESARTEHDDQLDEILGMIDLAEDSVAQTRRRAEENTAPVQPELFAEEIPAAEEAVIIEEIQPVEPEPVIEAEPKADLIVTPQPVVIQPEEPELILPELPETQPESPAAQSSIIASAEILRAGEPDDAEEPERCSSVPVMVKLRQQALRVQPRKKRAASHAVSAPAAALRSAMNSRRAPAAESILPPTVEDNVSFEQYIRNIARSVVTELPQQPAAQAEEAAPSRKFRQRAAEPVAEPVIAAAAEETAEEEKPSARKNRFPHTNSEFLHELLSSLRRSRTESAESGENTAEAEAKAEEDESAHSIFSEIIPENPRELLQNVIDKFIEVNTVPSRMVVPRTVRRYRD